MAIGDSHGITTMFYGKCVLGGGCSGIQWMAGVIISCMIAAWCRVGAGRF